MGNQPSAPQAPSTPQPTPPPLPPVCDAECQRQKTLSGLKAALDAKTATKDTDPEGYEQARIAYFTELNGQGWLAQEKQRIANEEIAPVINGYRDRYKDLQTETKNQGVFVKLMGMLKADEQQDKEELGGLNKKLQSEKDKADTVNRLNELNATQLTSSEGTSVGFTILDIFYVVLGFALLFGLYMVFRPQEQSVTAVPIGGKRLLRTLTR
jgi:hypothetical protein